MSFDFFNFFFFLLFFLLFSLYFYLFYLSGDLFLIWRETDLATEKEKIRLRNKSLNITENNDGISLEILEERRRNDMMSVEERNEYEKDKREEVVYSMLQIKYGLDEDTIADDANTSCGNLKCKCCNSKMIMIQSMFILVIITTVLFFSHFCYDDANTIADYIALSPSSSLLLMLLCLILIFYLLFPPPST